jgi:hypothetical protein
MKQYSSEIAKNKSTLNMADNMGMWMCMCFCTTFQEVNRI